MCKQCTFLQIRSQMVIFASNYRNTSKNQNDDTHASGLVWILVANVQN